jgi:hypothetical protein
MKYIYAVAYSIHIRCEHLQPCINLFVDVIIVRMYADKMLQMYWTSFALRFFSYLNSVHSFRIMTLLLNRRFGSLKNTAFLLRGWLHAARVLLEITLYGYFLTFQEIRLEYYYYCTVLIYVIRTCQKQCDLVENKKKCTSHEDCHV